MGKLAFLPFSLGSGLIAGVIARRVFARMWSLVDEDPPPKPEHRNVTLLKLAAAVTLEGAVFALTRGMVDHQARRAYEQMTGAWPGDDSPAGD